MNENELSPDVDIFFTKLNARMRNLLPQAELGPSPELLEAAWSVAQAQRRWAPLVVWRFFPIQLQAASTASTSDESLFFQGPKEKIENQPGGDAEERSQWTITRENLLDNDYEKILRFRTHPKDTHTYVGRAVEVKIGEEVISLGVIDPDGMASCIIRAGIDLTLPIDVRIGTREE